MPRLLANGGMRPTRSGFVSYANALAPNQTASLFRTADQCVLNVSSAFERRQQLRRGSRRFSARIEDWRGIDRVAGSSFFSSHNRCRTSTYSGTHLTPHYEPPVLSPT